MASYLMLAHLGSASCFSSFSQWRNAFKRHSNMNSGSLFLVEIRRMMSSFRPFGAASDSTSVTKPHLYSPSTRASNVLVSVPMVFPFQVQRGCGTEVRCIKPDKSFMFHAQKITRVP